MLLCPTNRFRPIDNVGREAFAQQRRFTTAGRTENHIPGQLPEETTVVKMALQTQQPAVEIALLCIQLNAEWVNGFLALLLLLFSSCCRRFIIRTVSHTRAINPHTAVASQRLTDGFSHCSSYNDHDGPFHQIHTSRKSHASTSSQKAETLNRGIAGRRADFRPLNSRGVGNLTKTPVLFYCAAVNFCSSCSSRDGSQSASPICEPVLNSIRYCCCASFSIPDSSMSCAPKYCR